MHRKFFTSWIILIACSIVVADQTTTGTSDSFDIAAFTGADVTVINEAVAYHNSLTLPLNEIKVATFNYVKSVTKLQKAKTVEKKRQELLLAIQKSVETLSKEPPFKNNSTLRVELKRYLDLIAIVLREDFGKILNMEEIESRSFDQEEAHQLAIDLAREKLNDYFTIVTKAEEDFFKTYKVPVSKTIKKDEMTLQIEKANKAIEYYNTVFRIFYKVNKEDAYTRKANEAKDVAALEQHVATLESFADEGLLKLDQIKAFEGDDDLRATAKMMLNFYKEEARTTYPVNVNFYLVLDNMQKATKKLNAIKKSERTQHDVDEYNQTVSMYNKAVKELNKKNKQSYKDLTKLIKLWNNKKEAFFDKHS
jgi:hypothetical protein